MKFFPLALGLVAIAAPAAANDSPTGSDSAELPVASEIEPMSTSEDTIALNFEPPQSSPQPVRSNSVTPAKREAAAVTDTPGNGDLYTGGSESVVARVVGAAEGTRAPDGSKTDIYEGHVDPGNGVWNRGTFSYQFGNQENLSAEEADRRQMAKIKRIHESVLLPKAKEHGIAPLSLKEELNGVDLINQAPLAVTENGGYVERLAEAKQKKGLSGEEAILEARIWSFWDGSKGGWDAPGLRAYDDIGKEESIRRDQQRRMGMIDEALSAYEQQQGAVARSQPAPQFEKVASVPPARSSGNAEKTADLIIFGTSQSDAQSGSQVATAP